METYVICENRYSSLNNDPSASNLPTMFLKWSYIKGVLKVKVKVKGQILLRLM